MIFNYSTQPTASVFALRCQLLSRVEGRLLQMGDDVLAHVLRGAGEPVEALADLLGERERGRAGTSHGPGSRRAP